MALIVLCPVMKKAISGSQVVERQAGLMHQLQHARGFAAAVMHSSTWFFRARWFDSQVPLKRAFFKLRRMGNPPFPTSPRPWLSLRWNARFSESIVRWMPVVAKPIKPRKTSSPACHASWQTTLPRSFFPASPFASALADCAHGGLDRGAGGSLAAAVQDFHGLQPFRRLPLAATGSGFEWQPGHR